MNIDLHCHSTISDGTLAPGALLAHAAKQGVQTLALTDHDATDGISAAREAANSHGIVLIPGLEASVSWNGQTIHVVGLHIDPGHAALQDGLARIREYRQWRAEEIGRRLAKKGIEGGFEGASAFASGSIVGRTHFARFLVERGYCDSVREVFKKYLVRGKPGYVPGEWASMEEAVGWIVGAGGMAVIAHPARYRITATRLRKLIGEFKECGGVGIEVVSGSHSRDDVQNMAVHAERAELYASCGSDYHGPENPWIELGRLPALPENCRPVWQHEAWPCGRGLRQETKA